MEPTTEEELGKKKLRDVISDLAKKVGEANALEIGLEVLEEWAERRAELAMEEIEEE